MAPAPTVAAANDSSGVPLVLTKCEAVRGQKSDCDSSVVVCSTPFCSCREGVVVLGGERVVGER